MIPPTDKTVSSERNGRRPWPVFVVLALCAVTVGLAAPEVLEDCTGGVDWTLSSRTLGLALVPFVFLPAGILAVIAFHFPDPRAAYFHAPVFYALMTAFFVLRSAVGPFPFDQQFLFAITIGFAVCTPAVPLLVAWRRQYIKAHSGPRCPQCGYLLFGNRSGFCPECGRGFSLDEIGLTEAELTATDEETVAKAMAIPYRRQPHFGLLAQLAFVLLAYFGMGFGTLQAAAAGPRIHHFWWFLALLAAGASLFTTWRVFQIRQPGPSFRFTHTIAAAIAFALAGVTTFSQIETLGTDMWAIPHRRVSLLCERFCFAYMLGKSGAASRTPQLGDPMDPNPPDLQAPTRFNWPTHDAHRVPRQPGPYYQRYLSKNDLELIGYRPMPTWIFHADIVILYTPRPIMIRKWFRPVPDAWVALHADGRTPVYRSADELRHALEKDNRARAAMNLPTVDLDVHDR